jgi:transglutaminase-like putative cysteine protease
MRISLSHVTLYHYDRLVALGPQTIRLKPMAHSPGELLFYALTVEPSLHRVSWQQDARDNSCAQIEFEQKVRRFGMTVDMVLNLGAMSPGYGHNVPLAAPLTSALNATLQEYRVTGPDGPILQTYLDQSDLSPMPVLSDAKQINEALHRDIRYLVRLEPGVQTPAQTLQLRSGSCRDTSWLLTHLLRLRGYDARFVSGYLIEPNAQTQGSHSELHAWCEVRVPDLGWIGLDPTSGLFAGAGHIPLAAGAHYEQAAPLEGTLEHCEAEFSFTMTIRALA